jgi:hypothetical protein
MKKLLLGATALAVISSAGAAFAQGAPATTVTTNNFNARIGGFMTLGVGYVDSDAGREFSGTPATATGRTGHNAEVEIVNNSEVIFNFSLTSDNGLTFGAKAEIENNSAGTTSDEYVGFVEGFFGRVEVGAEDGAADRLQTRIAGGTAFTAAADETGLLFDYAADQSPAVVVTRAQDTSDDLKITYFTPRFAGFQAAASYANGAEGPTSTDGFRGDREGYEVGANYKNSFGGVSLDVGASYVDFSDPYTARFTFDNGGARASRTPDDGYAVAANVGFAGFTVGGGYGVTSYATGDDDEAFGAGVNYATGPWLFGVQYAGYVGGVQDEDYGISAGVDYALAPGVTVGGVLEYADGEKGATAANQTNDAYAAGVFMNLGF